MMKSLLARIGLPRGFGLCVEDGAVTLSEVVATPLGPVEIGRRQEEVARGGLATALRRLMSPHCRHGRRQRTPVAVVLPRRRLYFATRPIQNTAADPSPHVLLREALRSVAIQVSEMAVDVVKAHPDKRPLASIVACNAQYMSELLESLKGCGVRPVRAEPEACALLRAANRNRAARTAKVALRLFLNDSEAFAVLVVKQLPIVWRHVDLRRGDEASTILSACRSLLMVSRDCGIESPLETLMLHGRSDLARLVDVDWLREQLGVPVRWFDGPVLSSAETALGSALGCWSLDQREFDLSRSFKPPVSLRDIVPWRQVAAQLALLLSMAMFLLTRYSGLQESYAALQVQNTENPRTATMQEAQLIQEKNELEQKVAAVQKFLGTRILWTPYGRQLAECLPPNAYLTSFHATCEMETADQKRGQTQPKQSLVVQGVVLLRQKGLMPQEIDLLLDKLRSSPLLKRDFPVVELAALKPGPSLADETPTASFTVLCLPKNSGASASPPRESKGEIAASEANRGVRP
jgi:hypothetical protein